MYALMVLNERKTHTGVAVDGAILILPPKNTLIPVAVDKIDKTGTGVLGIRLGLLNFLAQKGFKLVCANTEKESSSVKKYEFYLEVPECFSDEFAQDIFRNLT